MRVAAIVFLVGALASPAAAQCTSARAADRLRVGQGFLAAGDRGSAVGYLQEALRIDRRCGPAYVALAEAHRARGERAAAMEVLRAGLEQAPDHEALWLALASLRREGGQGADALAVLRAWLVRRPASRAGWARATELAREIGAWAEALALERRRAHLAAAGTLPAEDGREARTRIAALERLVSPLDPLTAPRQCERSDLRRALAGCGD